MNLLPQLRTVREGQALSIRALGLQSGVSPATILRAEQGQTVYPATIRKLARALRVTPAELRGDVAVPRPLASPPAPTRPAGPTPERARELAARYRAEGDIEEAEHWERIAERVAGGTP